MGNAGSRSLDKPFHGPMYDSGPKLDPHSGFLPHRPSGGNSHRDVLRSGPEFGQHHIKPFAYKSPGGIILAPLPVDLVAPQASLVAPRLWMILILGNPIGLEKDPCLPIFLLT